MQPALFGGRRVALRAHVLTQDPRCTMMHPDDAHRPHYGRRPSESCSGVLIPAADGDCTGSLAARDATQGCHCAATLARVRRSKHEQGAGPASVRVCVLLRQIQRFRCECIQAVHPGSASGVCASRQCMCHKQARGTLHHTYWPPCLRSRYPHLSVLWLLDECQMVSDG